MRRSEREITDRAEIDEIIRRSRACRLGLSDDGQPYVVPMFFGYDGRSLYFHCAHEGRKLDMVRTNNRVCVEFDELEELIEAKEGCGWSARYRCAIAFGHAFIVGDAGEKRKALTLIMAHYSNRSFSFAEDKVMGTTIIRVEIDALTGKRTGKPPDAPRGVS